MCQFQRRLPFPKSQQLHKSQHFLGISEVSVPLSKEPFLFIAGRREKWLPAVPIKYPSAHWPPGFLSIQVHISEHMLTSWPSPPLNFSSSWTSHPGPPATPFSSEPCCFGYELSWSLSFALSWSLSLHPHLCPLFLLAISSLLLHCFLTLLRTPPGASHCTPLTSIVKNLLLSHAMEQPRPHFLHCAGLSH